MLGLSTCYQFPGNFYQQEGDQFILIHYNWIPDFHAILIKKNCVLV